jgi:hypothetical protein
VGSLASYQVTEQTAVGSLWGYGLGTKLAAAAAAAMLLEGRLQLAQVGARGGSKEDCPP